MIKLRTQGSELRNNGWMAYVRRILMVAVLSLSSEFCTLSWVNAAFEDKGTGARGTALGDTYVVMGDDILSLAYNPASLARVHQKEMTSEYAKLFGGLTDGSSLGQTYLAYGQPIQWGGTLAASWKQFSLDDLYKERTLSLGYGEWLTETIAIGGTVKQLYHSFGVPDIIVDNNGNVTNGTPEFFTRNGNAKSAYSFDLGGLYRYSSKLMVAMSVQDINEPNIALDANDRDVVFRTLRAAVSYERRRNLNFAAALQSRQSLAHSRDTVATGAVEKKWNLMDGDRVALRGSLAVGSREYRQFAFGTGYEMGNLGFDYAFVFNMSGIVIGDTSGTHRFSMSYKFGMPEAPAPPILKARKKELSKSEADELGALVAPATRRSGDTPTQRAGVTPNRRPANPPNPALAQEMGEMEALIQGKPKAKADPAINENEVMAEQLAKMIAKGKAAGAVVAMNVTAMPKPISAPAAMAVSRDELLLRVSALLQTPASQRLNAYESQFELWAGYSPPVSEELFDVMDAQDDVQNSLEYYSRMKERDASVPERMSYLMLSMEKYLESTLMNRDWNLKNEHDLKYKSWLHVAWNYQRQLPAQGASANDQIANLQRIVAKAIRFERETPEVIVKKTHPVAKPVSKPLVKAKSTVPQRVQAQKAQVPSAAAQKRYENALMHYSKRVAEGAPLPERIQLLRKILSNCQQSNLDCRLAYQEFEHTFDEELKRSK